MNKALVKLVCLVLLVVLAAVSMLPAYAASGKKAQVVIPLEGRDRLNVHGAPSIDNVIDHLNVGTVVLYQDIEKGWWKITWRKANGQIGSGYVDPAYLTPIDEDSAAKYTCVDNLYVHSTSDIVLGECANYHIDQLMVGDMMTVVKQDGTWAYVEYGGGEGWVASIYLVKAN